MTGLTNCLETIQGSLETALKEVKNLHTFIAKLEKAMNLDVQAAGKKGTGTSKSQKAVSSKPKKPKKAVSAKAKKPVTEKPKKPAPLKKMRGQVGQMIMSVIEKNSEGASTKQIKQETGLDAKQISAFLNYAKREGKVNNPKRGVYVKV